MLVSGNKNFGLSQALEKLYPDTVFASRTTGFDLLNSEDQDRFATLSTGHDVIIICSSLYRFNQTVLLDKVYNTCIAANHNPHIICIGSVVERNSHGRGLYSSDKVALKDYCNRISHDGVWSNKPKVTYASFGRMSNTPDPIKKSLDIDAVASYIKWLIDQPRHIAIHEISIETMQNKQWYNSL